MGIYTVCGNNRNMDNRIRNSKGISSPIPNPRSFLRVCDQRRSTTMQQLTVRATALFPFIKCIENILFA